MANTSVSMSDILDEAVERLPFLRKVVAKFRLSSKRYREKALDQLSLYCCDNQECAEILGPLEVTSGLLDGTISASDKFSIDPDKLERLLQIIVEYLPKLLEIILPLFMQVILFTLAFSVISSASSGQELISPVENVKYIAIVRADDQIDVARKFLVEGVEQLEDASGYWLSNTRPVVKISDVALVKIPVDDGLTIVDLEVFDSAKQQIDVCDVTSDEKSATFIIKGAGKVQAKSILGGLVGGKLVWKKRTFDIDLGGVPEPPPKPPEPPTPPVPDDPFGNIGKRVAVWSANLPKRKELSAVYAQGAEKLLKELAATNNTVAAEIVSQREAILGADRPSWDNFISNLNADLKSRGSMTKGVLADYLKAVSLGLGAQ